METCVRAFLTEMMSQNRYSDNTVLSYQNDLRHFINHLRQQLGRAPVITDFNTDQLLAYLESESLIRKPSTLQRRLATLKRFGRYLAANGEIEPFEFSSGILGQPNHPETTASQKITWLTDEQVTILVAKLQADPRPQARRDQAILTLMIEIGLTASRVVSLNLPDFDRDKNRLKLQNSNTDHLWFAVEESGLALQKYLTEGRPELNPHPGETALFISQMGLRVSRQGVWQICRRWGKQIGLPVELTPRRLRYTAVRRMLQAGYTERMIQDVLEHNNLTATQGLLRKLTQTT